MEETVKVLMVDDEFNLLQSFQRVLKGQFETDIAVGAQKGLEALKAQGPYGVVVADMKMPGIDGIEFLNKVHKMSPMTVRVMLTGDGNRGTAINAVNEGRVSHFLNKPCSSGDLSNVLTASIEQYKLALGERNLLHGMLGGSVKLLSDIMALIDPASTERASHYRSHMLKIASALNIANTLDMGLGALLCDVGLIAVPPEIMVKRRQASPLSEREQEIVARACEDGSKLLENIPRLENAATIVRYQNKRFNGEGFPPGDISGEQIPVGARILKIVRDYFELENQGKAPVQIWDELRAREGWYDPQILTVAEGH